MPRALHRLVLALTASLVVACGGGAPRPADTSTTYPLPTEGGGGPRTPPPTTPGGGGPTPPPALVGGVLATFTVGTESFRAWVTAPATAQAVVDAWQGAAAPLTSICADVQPGPGAGQHNAPWNWSVNPNLPVLFGGICAGCAASWSSPSLAEAGITGGPPYNCDVGLEMGPRGMIRMQVVLVGVQDFR